MHELKLNILLLLMLIAVTIKSVYGTPRWCHVITSAE